MTARERLIGLINAKQVYGIDQDQPRRHDMLLLDNEDLADYLLANGVIVPMCKPIAVMSGESEFDTDVYCPYCETNLSGLYGEEPTRIIQCYNCGEFLDNRKTITKEEAEKALERSRG